MTPIISLIFNVTYSIGNCNILVMFQATLNLYAYFVKHYLAALCKFLGDFWAF